MVSFLDNEGLRYYDEKLKVWVEAKVGESSSVSDEKIKELDEKVKTKVANSLDMSLDETTYVLTVKLLSESGEELSKATVDLPIEELVKDGRYDEENKEIVLILEDGKEVRVPVGDLVENKVDKLDTEHMVYATDDSRHPKTIGIRYSDYPLNRAIPVRDGMGGLQVPTAQNDNQAVNKRQMDVALDGKVDKTTEHFIFYGTDSNGEPYYYRQDATDPTKWSVPIRNGNGSIVAANPTQDNELTTKKYVDTALQGKVDKTTESFKIYGTALNGTLVMIGYSTDPRPDTIAFRSTNGALKVGTPTADNHATTKKYVDNAIATAAVLVSPNGTKYKIAVDDAGTLSATEIS